MAFYNSKHYPDRALTHWMEKQGIKFGNDSNAHTSFDRTTYELELSNCTPATISKALGVFRDYADGILLRQDYIDSEQGVIDIEEHTQDTADHRHAHRLCEGPLKGTAYEHRFPIGKKETRHAFTKEKMEAFYRKWYRPDNMTVLLVGDFQQGDLTPLVHQAFSSIPTPTTPRPPNPSLGEINPQPHAWAVAINGYTAYPSLSLFTLEPTKKITTWEQYAENLFLSTSNLFYNKAIENYYATHKKIALASLFTHEATVNAATKFTQSGLKISFPAAHWKEAIENAIAFHGAFLQGGISAHSVKEVQEIIISALRQKAQNGQESLALLEALLSDAMEETPHIDPKEEATVAIQMMELLSVELAKPLIGAVFPLEELRKKSVWMVQSDIHPIPSSEVFAILQEALTHPKPLPDGFSAEEASPPFQYETEKLQHPSLYQVEENKKYGAETIRFSNGVVAHFKQVKDPSLHNTIKYRLTLAQGPWEFPLPPIYSQIAFNAVSQGSTTRHPMAQMKNFLYQIDATSAMVWANDGIGVTGIVHPQASLHLFEWIRAILTDSVIPASLLEQEKTALLNEIAQKGSVTYLLKTHKFLAYGKDPRERFFAAEEVHAWQPDTMNAWLKENLLSRCPEVTLVGEFDREEMIRNLDQVFGTLACRRQLPLRLLKEKAPKLQPGIHRTYARATEDSVAHVIQYIPFSLQKPIYAKGVFPVLKNLLLNRMMQQLRTEGSMAYSPSVSIELIKPWYTQVVNVIVPTAPEHVEKVKAQLQHFLQTLKFTQEELSAAIPSALKIYEPLLREDNAEEWLDVLPLWLQEDPKDLDVKASMEYIRKLTPEMVNQLMAEMFPVPLPYSSVVVVPVRK